jgi:hypothetical protein
MGVAMMTSSGNVWRHRIGVAVIHEAQKTLRAVMLDAQLTPRLACTPAAPYDDDPLGLNHMPTPVVAAHQHPAGFIEERNQQETPQDWLYRSSSMAGLQVQVQKRSHDRAGGRTPQNQAAQAIEVAAVKAQRRQALLPDDGKHDGEGHIQQGDANQQELCKATLRNVPLVGPHHGAHSQPQRD